jgi:hypothetical protein
MSNAREVTASGGRMGSGRAKVRIEKNLVMSPEADEFLAELSNRTGLSEGNVLRLALGMFKWAVDAKEQGEHVGVARNADALDAELVGF